MKHQWTAIIALPLTEVEIERIRLTGKLVLTNISEQRTGSATTVACIACDQAADDGVEIDSECPGEVDR